MRRPDLPIDDTAPDVDVDWSRLAADWQARDHRLRYSDETRADLANRVRALVVEERLDPRELRFADYVEGL